LLYNQTLHNEHINGRVYNMHAVVCQSLPLLLFISQQYYFHHLIQSSILVSFYSYRSSILLSRSQFHVIYDCDAWDDWSIAS